jgi:hypothetical protein
VDDDDPAASLSTEAATFQFGDVERKRDQAGEDEEPSGRSAGRRLGRR